MADQPENLVLIQLQGLRREMAAMLERQVRDRELTSTLYSELIKIYDELAKVRGEVAKVREEVATVREEVASFRVETKQEFRDLRADLIMLENQMQNRHNEVRIMNRRLDALGAPPD